MDYLPTYKPMSSIPENQHPQRWGFVLLLVLIFGVGFFVGAYYRGPEPVTIKGGTATTTSLGAVGGQNEPLPDYLTKDVQFSLFWDTWKLIQNHYYEKDIPQTQLFYGALQGMVAAVGDPHSMFLTPKDSADFAQDLQGNFEGIGAEIGIQNGQLIVITPLPETPAIRAGLKAKDAIIAIDDKDTSKLSLNEAVSQIRGEQGSSVVLTIIRGGNKAQKITIKREKITVKSLSWEFIENNTVVHIKIRQFNDDTLGLLNQAIAEIERRPSVTGIIVDVRNNPGGYLQSAIDIAGKWQANAAVVSEKLRDGSEIKHASQQSPQLASYATIVLVNAGSASASEIVAGALKDWGRARIVGVTTFGKGSVQDLTDLADGSSVKLTIAKWLTPNGSSIDGKGIEPDVIVELTDADYDANRDPQLDKAKELLKKK